MDELLIKFGLPLLVVGGLPLLGMLLVYLQGKLANKTDMVSVVLNKMLGVAQLVVAEIEATDKAALLAAAADGKLTAQEKADLKAMAVQHVKDALLPHEAAMLGSKLDVLASGAVEHAVASTPRF